MPQLITSGDPGAPQLTGEVGSLVNVLDAVLVNGFTDGVTATAALGWSIAHTDTYRRMYKGGVQSTELLLRIDDAAVVTDAKVAEWYGVETATDLDTFTNPFPMAGQMEVRWLHKSISLDSVVRSWFVLGDDKRFYLGIRNGNGTPDTANLNFFGDLIAHRPADAYHCTSAATVNVNLNYASGFGRGIVTSQLDATTHDYIVVARAYHQLPGAQLHGLFSPGSASSSLGRSNIPYPMQVDNGLWFSPVYVLHDQDGARGRLPGLFNILHDRPFDTDQVLDDLPGFPGRTFHVYRSAHDFGDWTNAMLEITPDSWV